MRQIKLFNGEGRDQTPYTVRYSRRIRNAMGEFVEVGLSQAFSMTPLDQAFKQVREQVEKWLAQEADRMLVVKGSQPNQNQPPEYY